MKVKGTLERRVRRRWVHRRCRRSHSTFGALLVGQYDDKGKLVYAGNVGTGFDDKMLVEAAGSNSRT